MGQVTIRKLNLTGDQQADLTVHGGTEKAVYAYPAEHYEYWRKKLPEVPFSWGKFSENLTTEGLAENMLCIGDRLRVGSDGNIVVAGGTTINGRADFALARYVGSAVLSTPDIDTAPASLAFGNVTQGSSKDLAVTVRNTGTATLNVTSTTLLGTAEYSIVAGGGAFSLAPAATRQVTVRLTPTSLSSKVATLSNVTQEHIERARRIVLIVSVQNRYSFADREWDYVVDHFVTRAF